VQEHAAEEQTLELTDLADRVAQRRHVRDQRREQIERRLTGIRTSAQPDRGLTGQRDRALQEAPILRRRHANLDRLARHESLCLILEERLRSDAILERHVGERSQQHARNGVVFRLRATRGPNHGDAHPTR
jgi:hypothetical protein